MTLRYAAEVKPATGYFQDLAESPVDEDQVALAQKLIELKSAPLNLAQFSDRYQTAVLDLIKAKIAGTAPIQVARTQAGKIVNLMEALRQSVAQSESKAASGEPVPRKVRRKKLALAA